MKRVFILISLFSFGIKGMGHKDAMELCSQENVLLPKVLKDQISLKEIGEILVEPPAVLIAAVRSGLDPDATISDYRNCSILTREFEMYTYDPVTFRCADKYEKCEVNAPHANVLLYYGADVCVKGRLSWIEKKFLNHAHARRVHRLACYLERCTNRQFPPELFYMIAEYRYGKLSSADWKLIEKYPADDYKKERKPAPVNNRSQS